jgi:inward rectifier potassium channel
MQYRPRDRARIIRLGDRTMIARGLRRQFWADLSHRSMTASWPAFICGAAVIFAIFNAIFATLYWLGDFLGERPIANTAANSFLSYLYFSIETLSTAGYGDMHPQTNYGHLVATVELFTGIFSMSLMTGLIFARFSRPNARLIFARHPLIGNHDGNRTLMIRFANARHNAITNATARLWMLSDVTTAEGRDFRRFTELPLMSGESPVFALSWTIFHVIDANSPLHGFGPDAMEEADISFLLQVAGFDESAGQTVRARRAYTYSDVRYEHRYVDIFDKDESGLAVMDYSRLHDIAKE